MKTRRTFLQLLAAAPLLGVVHANARDTVIPRLIKEGQGYDTMHQRLDHISRALIGVRYKGHTLIGGPRQPEVFVTRDDAFDCVTYCEAVLAAAMARDFAEYEAVLRRIRYANDEVVWAERNHDFAQWNHSIVGKKICKSVDILPAATVEKWVSGGGLGNRHYKFDAIPTPLMLTQQKSLLPGDVVGFVSRRPELDFFHTGFVAFSKRGTLMLRHASQRHGRVTEQEMTAFIAETRVKYVTILRAKEIAPVQS